MKPDSLLIRADASTSIGTGHIMRCFALAQAWEEAGGDAAFSVAEMPEVLRPRLTVSGFEVSAQNATPGSREDAVSLAAQARKLAAGWIVVDGDRFDGGFLESLASTGFRVLLVDDFASRQSFPASLIVNPNLGADARAYRDRGSQAAILSGPHYAMMRREFRAAFDRQFPQNATRVLVTLGGSDPDKLTARIATALADLPGFSLTLVVGAGHPDVAQVQALRAPNVVVVADAQNMAELMKASDLAIIAAGGTLWELLALACPVLSYARNPVQSRVIQSLAKDEIVVDLGDTARFDPAVVVAEVAQLAANRAARERMAQRGRALVDGLGAARVVEAMRHLGAH
jgi:UDP-2,4-diacetamido-2,4,6-trideoxy-beta-L-altropyranose hydrolase